MKPVHLTLTGLQSYREKQEVDFLRLSDAGVFGIFGPTGSGKSSILDAVTLALYGKVERAPGGTQGIINQMEPGCTVTFTFELNGAGGSERYRVERQYKRTGDVTVNQSMSRLIRLEGGDSAVIADKAKDVDNRVQEILGLSMQDFTRAVVLPQGKFAEFLSLKGVERRHMLERLFHLEQYGDALGSKVNALLRETDMAVKRAEAEQLGLGNASEAALKEARERLAEAERVFQEQRVRLAAAEREAEERRRLWKLAQERKQVAETERVLREREPEMAMLAEKLRLSAQAGRVSHFLKEWEEARTAMAEAEAKLDAAEKEYARTQALYDERQAAYREAKAGLEREAEPLQQRLESLKRSMELHREIRAAGQESAERSARERALQAKLEEAGATAGKEQLQLQKGQALQAELKLKLAALEVPASYREMLQSAWMDKQKAELARGQLENAASELLQAEQKLAPLREETEQLNAQEDGLIQTSHLILQQGRTLQSRIGETLLAAGRLTAACKESEAAELHEEQERYRSSLASNLAATLEEGVPCPVCGSAHHPAPAVHNRSAEASSAVRTADWKALQDMVTGRILVLKQQLGVMDGEWSRLEAHGSPLAELLPGLAQQEAAAALAELGAFPYEVADKQAAGLGAQAEALGEEAAVWCRRVRECVQAKELHRTRSIELSAQRAALEAALKAAAMKWEELDGRCKELTAAWLTRYPDFSADRIEEDWSRLQGVLKEQEEIRSRLDKAEPFLAGQQEKLARLQEESFRLERELVQVATERREREALLEEKRGRLLAELGEALTGEETEALWSRTADRLQALKQAELDGRLLLEQLQEKLMKASGSLAGARQAHASAGTALERAEANGRRELSEAGFADRSEALGALLDPVEAGGLEEQVRKHRDQVVEVRARLQQLELSLEGATITEELWSEGEAALATDRLKDEECLGAKARAERDLEELEEKHERWQGLEKERSEAQTVLSRLQKLQSVLRGNAFVEFMAEEQLSQVSRAASERLSQLTRRRYALETDSTGGFVIRDDANGGLKRPVSTLSGGETFLTSLSLALALSAQIQLNGKYPLEFFFLDEGFGTLDPDLLETVVHALEKLHMEKLTVGVISHVPELKARLPRRLVVTPSSASGPGSRIEFESL